ncbi:MAG: uroporphyrinogen decarboxylase family protein, partial [Acidobacteriota bacterium]
MGHLLIDALWGRDTPRRPLWLMRQAGRILPEYRALRETHSFEELCAEPELAATVTLQPLQRFPLDAAIVFADLMTPVEALGIEVEFAPGPVVSRPLDDPALIRALPRPEPEQIAPKVMETLRLVVRELDGRVPVLGFAGGPWSIAAYLVQGQGKREFPGLRALAVREPEAADELLGRLTEL